MADDKKIIFSMRGVSKTLNGGKQIIKDIHLSFFYGAKIGIIGLNGSGKSTIMRIIAGEDKDFDGEVVVAPGYNIGYLPQDPKLTEGKTVKEVVEEGAKEVVGMLADFEKVNNSFSDEAVMNDPDKMEKLMQRQAELQDEIEAAGGWEIDTKLQRAMDALQCPPADSPVENLSGGEKRRVALCRLLLQEPDILLLDEPTNHLDAESVYWLEKHLHQYKGTVIAITHDRYFLDNLAGWILELDRGEGIPWKGNYTGWLEQKSKRLDQEEKKRSRRKKTLDRELEWIKMSPKGRRAKGKARLNNYEDLLNKESKEKESELEIYIPNGPRLGSEVINANNVSKSFDDRLLIENLNFKLPPAGVVGIIGPNGVGKTTLFRMIMGQENPDKGDFKLGETVKTAYSDQEHGNINPEDTVWEAISGGNETMILGGKSFNSRAYVARFNFSGNDQNKKVKVLSGGERNRLHLALTLKSEANVLLLDEPTNDLDINTLRALEEAIENFAGCVVVISHDRWFLDRICTHILAFEGEANVYPFEGGFTEYEENRKKRLGDEPQRFKYKKLVKEG